MKEALTFDDVLLIPQKSVVSPSKVDTAIFLTPKIKLAIPLISAAMDTVTESEMAIVLAKAGGLGIIHKNMSPAQQAAEVKKVKGKKLFCGAAVAIGEEAIKRAKILIAAGVDVIVIDVAHGHYYKVAQTIKILKKLINKKVILVGGNVATGKATIDLIKAGADVIKVGVGPGSICTTRVIAGIGVPQLTAVMDAVKAAKKTKTPVIADGGIKYSGDIVKALAAGADSVMIGQLFAATEESPGDITYMGGQMYKIYRGMGSIEAMSQGARDRYGLKKDEAVDKLIPEGIVGQTLFKGKLADRVHQLIGGLRAGLGYTGSKNINELHKRAKFIQISPSSIRESHPHDVTIIKEAPNYQTAPFTD